MAILTRDVLWHIVAILKSELQLDDSRVYIYQQKYNLPTDFGILIAVGMESVKLFSSKTTMDGNGNETQVLRSAAQVWLDIVSQDTSALDRKDEVAMALGSQFSQSIQEKYGFHIGRLPPAPIANLSEVEGVSIPFRFRLSFQVQYKITKSKPTPYYDTFSKASLTTES